MADEDDEFHTPEENEVELRRRNMSDDELKETRRQSPLEASPQSDDELKSVTFEDLMDAIFFGNHNFEEFTRILDQIPQNSSLLNKMNEFGDTAILSAINWDCDRCLELLIRKGADATFPNNKPVLKAAIQSVINNKPKCYEVFRHLGINLNSKQREYVDKELVKKRAQEKRMANSGSGTLSAGGRSKRKYSKNHKKGKRSYKKSKRSRCKTKTKTKTNKK